MGMAVLLVVAALGVLAYRIKSTLKVEPANTLLQLGDDVKLETPPPPSSGDLEEMQAKIRQLESFRPDYLTHKDVTYTARTFARAAIQAGDLLSGRAALQYLIAKHPDSALIDYDLLGRCQIELADLEGAIATYDRLIARQPDAVQGYVGKSRALSGLNKNAEAGQMLVQAGGKLKPSDDLSYLILAVEFDRLRDLSSALKYAEMARAAKPDDAAANAFTAGVLFKLRRFDEARAMLQKRIDENPRDDGSRKIMAQVMESPLFPHRDRALAEHYFLQVLQLKPGDPDSCWRLAQICADEGRFKQAAYLYGVLLEKAPDSAAGRKQYGIALQKLGNAAAAKEQGDWAKTLLERDTKLADLAARRDRSPGDPEIHAQIARAQLAANHYHEALVELQAAFAIAPGNDKYLKELRALNEELGLSLPELTATARS